MTQNGRAATRLAARLLFGEEAPAPGPGAGDEDDFLEVAVRNKMPMGVVDPAALERLVPAAWERARDLAATERDRLATSAREYTAIARAWAGRDIPAVLIKSPGYFPYTSDNVDVLVAERHAPRARATLEELGYRELPWVREPFKILLRKAAGDPPGFAIHLHTRVAWINSFFEGADVLDTSVPFGDDETLRRPGPEMAFLVTTAHWFYEDKELKLRDLYHSREILRDPVDWERVAAAATRGGWDEGLRSAVHLLRRAAADLGVSSVSSLLPALPAPASRWSPGFSAGVPVTALPARIERRKAKVMHFDKSLRNPGTSIAGRVREAALVFAYALKVRFPALQRAPLFVVGVASGGGRSAVVGTVRGAAAVMRDRFSLPVEVHDDTPRRAGMLTTGGIHILTGGRSEPSRPHALVHEEGGSVRIVRNGSGGSETVPADPSAVAGALARAYLESVA